MALYAQLFLNTVQIGSVYMLFSLGLTIIFGVMRVVNFAHGELFAAAALLVAALVPAAAAHLGVPIVISYALSIVAAMVAVSLLGAVLYQFGFRLYLRDMTGSFILSLGFLLLLQGVLVEIFTGVPRVVPPISEETMVFLGGRVTVQRLVTCAAALVLATSVIGLIKYTNLGMALRAVSEDYEAAMLQGIKYGRIAFVGFLVGVNLAAAAGCLIAPLFTVTPFMGADYLVRAFIIVIIGGLGSISGTVLASFVVALLDTLGGFYFDPTTTTIAMFALVMLLLVLRPQGLMGRSD